MLIQKNIQYVEFVRQLKNYILMVMLHMQAMPNPMFALAILEKIKKRG